jgi:hypothetical protein
MENLGIAELKAGVYHQIRLMIGDIPDEGLNIFEDPHPSANYIIDVEDVVHPLKVPSGVQSGVKLVHEFEVEEDGYVELILDFDAHRSIVKAGKSGKYILKPTIKIIGTKVDNGQTTDIAEVTGTVSELKQGLGPVEEIIGTLANARVSAQQYDCDSGELTIVASTITNEDGKYAFYLDNDTTYFIVATADGYLPQYSEFTTKDEFDSPDFVLEPADDTGTIFNLIFGNILNDENHPDLYLSYRIPVNQVCVDTTEPKLIEVAYARVEYDETSTAQFNYIYAEILPTGPLGEYVDYYLAYSAEGAQKDYAGYLGPIELTSGVTQTMNITID